MFEGSLITKSSVANGTPAATQSIAHPAASWAVVLLLTLIAFKAHAYKVDPSAFLALSKTCQAWYVNAYQAKKATGMNLDGWPNEWAHYERALGSAAPWVNHYCPAQVELHRLKNHYHGAISEQKRQEILRRILSELRYQIVNTRNWNQGNAWFKAEVHNYQAMAYELAGENGEAMKLYNEAIKAHAANVPGYWGLAQILVKEGRFEEAEAALQMALKHVSSKNLVARIEAELDDLARKKSGMLTPPAQQATDNVVE